MLSFSIRRRGAKLHPRCRLPDDSLRGPEVCPLADHRYPDALPASGHDDRSRFRELRDHRVIPGERRRRQGACPGVCRQRRRPRTAEQAYDIIIPASELQNLPDYKLYVRTLLAGRPLEPFLVHSFPPFKNTGTEYDSETLIKTSLQRYGRDRAKIEQRLNSFLDA